MVWEYILSLFHGSATSTNHQDHLLDRHYNNVAEVMSSVCDWARLDLCLKPQGPASSIKCMEDGCNCVLHHMCQCPSTWQQKVLSTSTSSCGQGPVSCRDWSSFQSSPGIQPINNWDNVHNDYCHISSPHGEYKHYWPIPTCWWTRRLF